MKLPPLLVSYALLLQLAAGLLAPEPVSLEGVDWPAAEAAKKKRRKKKRRRATPAPAPAPAPEPASSDLVPSTSFRGPTRLDFDDRLIQGQTNKSGAVYLFDRKETGIRSMVRRRKSFRQLTLRTVYDR